MSDDHPKRDTMAIEETTVSNMWEIAAIVEVLERKGLCIKQDLYDIITEFRRKNPRASIPETAFPGPSLLGFNPTVTDTWFRLIMGQEGPRFLGEILERFQQPVR